MPFATATEEKVAPDAGNIQSRSPEVASRAASRPLGEATYTTPSATAGEAVKWFPNGAEVHSSAPVCASRAYSPVRSPWPEETYTTPSATVGEARIPAGVGNLQRSGPEAASRAYRFPSADPQYTTPSATAGL